MNDAMDRTWLIRQRENMLAMARRAKIVLSQDLTQLRSLNYAELDLAKVADWPPSLRRATTAIVFIVSLLVSYIVVLSPLEQQSREVQKAELKLHDRYSRLAFQAANLETYRAQMGYLKSSLNALLEQLPNESEVPDLLEEIGLLANGSGLAVESLSLEQEREATFYTELPILLKVTGGYHDFGHFIAGLAALPRIVTLQDFSLSSSPGGGLSLSLEALTYRYQRPINGQPGR